MSCPAWCASHTPAGFLGTIPLPEVHQASRWSGPVSVALMQVADGQPYLSFNAVTVDLSQAPHLVNAMQQLGHADIAAAIAELAALATRSDPVKTEVVG